MDNKIDFVITWVDDSDSKWREAYEYHSAKEGRTINADACRYRDWDTLRYWFRGVEKFAPWVNKIYFVTYGHLPKWLNTDNPKLVIVKHEDFIPAQYLPTFSSNVIELYFHKIKGLSDKFVYFNDDMFLIDDVSPDRFFKKGLPCDMGALEIWRPDRIVFSDMVLMSIGIINTNFDKKAVLNKNIFKWYNKAYIKVSLRNFLYHRLDFFPGFFNHHLPQGYLKHIYDEIWSNCEEDLTRTSYNKFRAYGDVAPWLIRYWQLASGNFSPCNVNNDGKAFYLCDDIISECVDCISHQKKKLICLNDDEHVTHFEENKQQLLRAFEQILPEKSSFERLPEGQVNGSSSCTRPADKK